LRYGLSIILVKLGSFPGPSMRKLIVLALALNAVALVGNVLLPG
jgi:hypothetical protein